MKKIGKKELDYKEEMKMFRENYDKSLSLFSTVKGYKKGLEHYVDIKIDKLRDEFIKDIAKDRGGLISSLALLKKNDDFSVECHYCEDICLAETKRDIDCIRIVCSECGKVIKEIDTQ